MPALYDRIGVDYANLRRPDRRIAAATHAHFQGAETVLNVGAGAGSYEPEDCAVTAVEPSAEMIRQRLPSEARVIQGVAEELPFEANSFDAAMAVLTVHHWSDIEKGLREMRRVTRGRIIVLTYDPLATGFWLLEYLPKLAELDRKQMPGPEVFETALGAVRRIPVPVPHDCTDGMLCAYWRRPAVYLDPVIRRSMSSFWKIGDVSTQMNRLDADLRDGTWERKYAHFLDMDSCDFGYHLMVTT